MLLLCTLLHVVRPIGHILIIKLGWVPIEPWLNSMQDIDWRLECSLLVQKSSLPGYVFNSKFSNNFSNRFLELPVQGVNLSFRVCSYTILTSCQTIVMDDCIVIWKDNVCVSTVSGKLLITVMQHAVGVRSIENGHH